MSSPAGISNLIGGVPVDILLAGIGNNPRPLTADELQTAEGIAHACDQVHGSAVMGLEIAEAYIYDAQASADAAKLNQASALIGLLTDIVFSSHDAGGKARMCLVHHYKNIAEQDARPGPATAVVTPIASRRRRTARGAT